MENNKLTPKQRAEIYLKAAEIIDNDITSWRHYICCKLDEFNVDIKDCPEIKLIIKDNDGLSWVNGSQSNITDNKERIIALLLSYQMALDAKK